MTNTDPVRESFERWLKKARGTSTCRWEGTGEYTHFQSQRDWQTWQAALASAPLSAPVGVEGLMQLARKWCIAWGEWAHDNDPDGAKEDAAEAALLEALTQALAQQPAACPKCDGTGEADSGGVMPWGAPATIPCDCQQPAAVDGAMVERATMTLLGKTHDTAPGVDWRCDRSWTVNRVRELMRRALTAALAAQSRTDAAQPPAEAQVWCPSCDGAGWTPDAMDGSARAICPDCAGSGRGEHSITVNEAQAQGGGEVVACNCPGEGKLDPALHAPNCPARAAPPSAPVGVAYLDIGAGGYMDLGSELSDEELAKLPYGRHVLGIIGTHGVDGYALAQQPVPPNAVTWHPIETAPKDNKRPLYLAQFNTETGDLIDLDWDASWEPESESWEIPQVYYIWRSANGRVEEPTHWAYQDLASAPQQPVGEPVCFIHPNDADMLKEQHKALRDIATYWKKPGNDAVPVYLGTPAQPGGSDNGSI